ITCLLMFVVARLSLLAMARFSAFTLSLHDAVPISLPEAVAVFVIEPASRSAWVMVCVAVQVVVAAGANGPLPHGLIVPSLLSLTEDGPSSVTLPAVQIR